MTNKQFELQKKAGLTEYEKWLIKTVRQYELLRIQNKMFEYVKLNRLRSFQIWLNKECKKELKSKNGK